MAKKAKIKEEIKDEDLLGDSPKEEQPSVEIPKDKVLLGYHPITGDEVWSK